MNYVYSLDDGVCYFDYEVLYAEGEISAACAFDRFYGWLRFCCYHEGE